MSVELLEHQLDAIERMHPGCILTGGVGTGKTHTALGYYVTKICGGDVHRLRPMQTPVDLLVITKAKKRDELDWQSTALEFGLSEVREYSYGGVTITVDSWQNIKKYETVSNIFLLGDEQGVSGDGQWVKSFLKIAKNNDWILLSATPADTWMDYIPVFLANGFYRNRTQFIEDHVVWRFRGQYREVRGFFGVKKLKAYRDAILVDMPYERHTRRNLIPVDVDYDRDLFEKVWVKRWNVYDDLPLVDVAEMYRVGRKVVNSDARRRDAIVELGKTHPRMIIFYSFDYELESLRTLHSEMDIVVAEWNGKRHEPVPDTDRWLYLVQYAAGDAAWNCTSTDTVVYHSLTYSHKQFEQTQGRIDRLNSPFKELYYYILKGESKVDQRIWKSLMEKKTFHEEPNRKF